MQVTRPETGLIKKGAAGCGPCAETVGFEPTCRKTDNLISSQARYDHFDTSPDNRQRPGAADAKSIVSYSYLF